MSQNLGLITIISVSANCAVVITIFLLFWSINLSRRIATVTLINELESEFTYYSGIFTKLQPDGTWYSKIVLTHEEIHELEKIAAFFAKLKHFLDLKVLDWNTLNLLFCGRFFTIIHNVNIIEYVVKPRPDDWKNLMDLKKDWEKHLPFNDERKFAENHL